MQLTLIRSIFTDTSTIGTLYVNDVRECFTLEDKVREVDNKNISEWKIQDKTAIPRGTYKIVINLSPKYHKEMLMLLDVKGFSGVRIHSGNVAEDTDGCILVGTTIGINRVNHSVDAMLRLYPKIKSTLDKNEEVTITIK